jgi:hypothetical protein
MRLTYLEVLTPPIQTRKDLAAIDDSVRFWDRPSAVQALLPRNVRAPSVTAERSARDRRIGSVKSVQRNPGLATPAEGDR